MRLLFWHAVLSVVMGRLIAATQGGGNFHNPSITASDKQMEDCRHYGLSTLPPLLSIKAKGSVDHRQKVKHALQARFSLISLYTGHSPSLLIQMSCIHTTLNHEMRIVTGELICKSLGKNKCFQL